MPPETEPIIIPAPEGAPHLHHPALHILYHSGCQLPKETHGNLLRDLPHDTLAADLCAIMQWGLDNYSLLSGERADSPESWAPLHAYLMAGAVGRPELLPCLLRMLAAPADALDFYFGDVLTEESWWSIRQYMPAGMEAGLAFIEQAGVYEFAKAQVLGAMMYATEGAPGSRALLMQRLTDIVPGFLQRGAEPDFGDYFITTEPAIRLIEHGGEAGIAAGKTIFDANLADESIAGDFEDVLRKRAKYATRFAQQRLQGVEDVYRSLNKYTRDDEDRDNDNWKPAELALNEPAVRSMIRRCLS